MAFTPTIDDIKQHINLDENQNYTPSQSDVEQMLGAKVSEPSALSKAAGFADKYINKPIGKPVGAFGAGVVKGGYNSLASLGNLLAKPTGLQLPYYHPENAEGLSSLDNTLISAGDIVGGLLPAGRAAKLARGVEGAPSLLRESALTGLAGAALGGSDENDLQSRLIGGIGGAAFPFLSSFFSPAIVDRTLQQKDFIDKTAKKSYQTLFKGISNEVKNDNLISSLKKLPRDFKKYQGNYSPDLKTKLQDFVQQPNWENAHWFQSELGAESRRLSKQLDKLPADSGKRKTLSRALDAVNDSRNNIQETMKNFLEKNDAKDYWEKYKKIGSDFKEKNVPFKLPEIQSYKKGGTSARGLVDAMKAFEKQPNNFGAFRDIPGFNFKQNLDPFTDILGDYAKKGAAIGILGEGAHLFGAPGLSELAEAIKYSNTKD